MRLSLLLTLAGATLLALAPAAAHAQYYPNQPYYPDRPPPPGYGYGGPGYPPPPPRYRERPIGFRCEAPVATPSGTREIVCPLRRGRPLDDGCTCPPPPPPPGYSVGGPLPGRVIP